MSDNYINPSFYQVFNRKWHSKSHKKKIKRQRWLIILNIDSLYAKSVKILKRPVKNIRETEGSKIQLATQLTNLYRLS